MDNLTFKIINKLNNTEQVFNYNDIMNLSMYANVRESIEDAIKYDKYGLNYKCYPDEDDTYTLRELHEAIIYRMNEFNDDDEYKYIVFSKELIDYVELKNNLKIYNL